MYLENLRQNNYSLINLFSSTGFMSRYGCWGHLEATDQDRRLAFKVKGVKDYIYKYRTCEFPPEPQCPDNCSDSGVCVDGKCYCYYSYSGPTCNISRYIEYIDCSYLCTFNQGIFQVELLNK